MPEETVTSCKAPPWLDPLRTLPDDWNGEGSFAPSAQAFATVEGLIQALDAQSLPIDEVGADAMGGLVIELVGTSNRKVHFTVLSCGQAYILLLARQVEDVAIHPVHDNATAVRQARAFLIGE